MTTTREDIVTHAHQLAGLSADPVDALTRRVYLDTIAPGETPARAAEMARASGCALTCRAILRRFIVHPILEAPYRDRQAVTDLTRIAADADALTIVFAPRGRSPVHRVEAEPGDMLIVGGGDDGGGPEHAWTALTSVEDPGYNHPYPSLLLDGLDGGQRTQDAGRHQCIQLRDHELRDGWDITSTYRRRVRYVIDVMAIVGRFGR
jgi:hypothetical protein